MTNDELKYVSDNDFEIAKDKLDLSLLTIQKAYDKNPYISKDMHGFIVDVFDDINNEPDNIPEMYLPTDDIYEGMSLRRNKYEYGFSESDDVNYDEFLTRFTEKSLTSHFDREGLKDTITESFESDDSFETRQLKKNQLKDETERLRKLDDNKANSIVLETIRSYNHIGNGVYDSFSNPDFVQNNQKNSNNKIEEKENLKDQYKLYLTKELNSRSERYYIDPLVFTTVQVEQVDGYDNSNTLDYIYGNYSIWCENQEKNDYNEDYTLLGQEILEFGNEGGVIPKRDNKLRTTIENTLQNPYHLKENYYINNVLNNNKSDYENNTVPKSNKNKEPEI